MALPRGFVRHQRRGTSRTAIETAAAICGAMETFSARVHAGPRLHLLGDPKVEVAGATVQLERKEAGLLAWLAVEGPTPRNKIASLLWPDKGDGAARNNLRQRLYLLRQRAGCDLTETSSEVLRLTDNVWHDIAGIGDLLIQDVAAAPDDLLGVLDYSDCEHFDAWARAARQQWRVARRSKLAEIASRLERDGHVALALQYGERLIKDDPLLEHAHRRLMRLHYLRGDRVAALSAFSRCRDLLRRELGASPDRETLELAALVEASGVLPVPRAMPSSVTLLRPPRLIGRDTELRRLKLGWEAKRFMLLRGESGVGKSRLLTDFAASSDRIVLVGARPGDEHVAYIVLTRLLRAVLQREASPLRPATAMELARLIPELGVEPHNRLNPLRLRRAVEDTLHDACASGQVTGCAIDDLRFADEASAELFLAIASSETGRSMGWCVTARADDMPRQLCEWLAVTDPTKPELLELGPLDVSSVEALLHSLALPDFDTRAWAEPLTRHTGGNPLFILETLAAMLAQGAAALQSTTVRLPAPGNVCRLIEWRINELSSAALRLARVAALAGPDFNVELAARMLKVHPLDLAGAWRDLEDARVFRDNAFAHDLILETTLRSVPEPIAQVMHRDIAAEMQASGAPAASVARQLQLAREWHRAGIAFTDAAHTALAATEHASAARHWTKAAECFDRDGAPTEAFDARVESIEALLQIPDSPRAQAEIDSLLRTVTTPTPRLSALAVRAEANRNSSQ
jgi:DNA-binding SARP family transcriptional activator